MLRSSKLPVFFLQLIMAATSAHSLAFGSFVPLGAGSGATDLSTDGRTICGAGGAGQYWDDQRRIHLISGTDTAFGVSGDGRLIVGEASPPNAFLYTIEGAFEIIGSGRANGVSRDGLVVVGMDKAGKAFKWTRQFGKRILADAISEATACSDDGSVIVGSFQRADGSTVPGRWTEEGGFEDLGLLTGYEDGVATAVNGDGSIIVGYCTARGPKATGFIWLEDRGNWTKP